MDLSRMMSKEMPTGKTFGRVPYTVSEQHYIAGQL